MASPHGSLTGQAGILLELVSGAIAPTLAEHGLSETLFELLSAVQAAGNEATQKAVGQRMGVAPATLSEAVKAAVAGGWLTQEPSAADRRIRILKVSPQGSRAAEAVLARTREIEEEWLQLVGPDQMDACLRVLRSISSSLARSLAKGAAKRPPDP